MSQLPQLGQDPRQAVVKRIASRALYCYNLIDVSRLIDVRSRILDVRSRLINVRSPLIDVRSRLIHVHSISITEVL